MEICRLEHVKKEYRMGEVIAPLQDVSLTVYAGDFMIVEGPSGIGKSTLLYVLGTLLQSDSGCYYFEGRDISKLSDAEKAELRANKIGFLFQDAALIQALTLRENLIMTQKLTGRKSADKTLVNQYLELFGLTERADFFPYQLSGGQKRRAMAARCLINRPELILADEPTNDLDAQWSEKMIRILKEKADHGAGVVMVTHDSRWTSQATHILDLTDGVLYEKEEEN